MQKKWLRNEQKVYVQNTPPTIVKKGSITLKGWLFI